MPIPVWLLSPWFRARRHCCCLHLTGPLLAQSLQAEAAQQPVSAAAVPPLLHPSEPHHHQSAAAKQGVWKSWCSFTLNADKSGEVAVWYALLCVFIGVPARLYLQPGGDCWVGSLLLIDACAYTCNVRVQTLMPVMFKVVLPKQSWLAALTMLTCCCCCCCC